MSVDYYAYSRMLSQQVDMCFPFEYAFYKNTGIPRMNDIVEIGSGNGYFLNTLSNYFKSPRYYGYDICPDLVKHSIANSKNVSFSIGSIENVNVPLDAIILRLVLHQISDRANFLNQINEKIGKGKKVIIIDAYDDKFILSPNLPQFTEHLKKHRNILSPNAATRDIKNVLSDEMKNIGFSKELEEYYCIPSLLPGFKEQYFNYMDSTSKIIGCSKAVTQEIENWYQDPDSFVQMSLIMYSFVKN